MTITKTKLYNDNLLIVYIVIQYGLLIFTNCIKIPKLSYTYCFQIGILIFCWDIIKNTTLLHNVKLIFPV